MYSADRSLLKPIKSRETRIYLFLACILRLRIMLTVYSTQNKRIIDVEIDKSLE